MEYCLENKFQPDNNEIFNTCCLNGHLSLAQWLHGLGGIDIHAKGEIFVQKVGLWERSFISGAVVAWFRQCRYS
jgi:hypothetical protein